MEVPDLLTWSYSFKNKMEKGDGLTLSEFLYPLMQAWDWWHMYSTMDVQIQVGGSDQYGNITAGRDAVRYIAQNHQMRGDQPVENELPPYLDADGKLKPEAAPMGLTVPLLTTATGEKFGKSAGNAIWLDPNMTSPFDLYGVSEFSSSRGPHCHLLFLTATIVPPTLLRCRCTPLPQPLHLPPYRNHPDHYG